MRAGALRNFIFVMGKYQILSAAMNVYGVAEVSPGHRRALNMPARATSSPGAIPAWLI